MNNDENEKIVDGYKLTYSSEWISQLETINHWIYYWNQASIVINTVPTKQPLIEVGIGSKFLSNYLKSRGYKITTIDIDPNKSPDIHGDISTISLDKYTDHLVLAFEIFEHLPYSLFERTIANFKSAGIKNIIFSVPWSEYQIAKFCLSLPFLQEKTLRITIPKGKIVTHNHYWEIKHRSKTQEKTIQGLAKGCIEKRTLISTLLSYGYRTQPLQKVDKIQFFKTELF